MKNSQETSGPFFNEQCCEDGFQYKGLVLLLAGAVVGFFLCSYLPFLNYSISLSDKHPFILNVFMVNYTFMGSYYFALALILVLAFYFRKIRLAANLSFSVVLTVLMIQVIKNLMNGNELDWFTEKGQYLFFEDESELGNYFTFPSDYTAMAFAIASVLAAFAKRISNKLFLYMGAVLLGFSRIYLAQHSLEDVFAGAAIGLAAACISFYLSNYQVKSLRSPLSRVFRRPKAILPGLDWKKAF